MAYKQELWARSFGMRQKGNAGSEKKKSAWQRKWGLTPKA